MSARVCEMRKCLGMMMMMMMTNNVDLVSVGREVDYDRNSRRAKKRKWRKV